MSFSPDGRTFAVGDSDGSHATLTLVDARTHRVRASITVASHAVTADVSFAPDGRTLITGEAVSGRFDPAAEVLVRRSADDGDALAHSKPIPDGRLIGFVRNGRFVFVTSKTTSYLLDARTLSQVRRFSASGAAAVSPNGNAVALGNDDGSVSLLDLSSGAIRPVARRAASPVLALAFTADGRTLATASDDGGVDIWDLPTGTLREAFAGHAGAAFGLLFTRDGATLYSGSSDGRMIVWDVRGERRLGRPFRFAPMPKAGEGAHTPPANGAESALAVSPDGRLFATVPAPNRITIWRLRDERVVAELHGPCGEVGSLAFSHDGRLLAAVGSTRQTVVWNLATRKVIKLIGPNGPTAIVDVGFSPDDSLLATADDGGQLRVYSFPSGRTIASIHVKGSLQALAFSPDGSLLAAGGLSGDVAIWSTARRALERTMRDPNGVQSLQFAPDGKEIATGELNGNVEFWDPATGHRVGRTLGGQNGDVLGVVFDPSGTELVTTSTDGKLRLWDLPSGKLVGAPLPGADTGGWGTFTPDGEYVIAAFWSGTGIAWNVDPAAWKTQACRIAHRNLTRGEWHDFLPGRGYRRVCP
jgi:WD40 repeat protein